MKARLHAFVVHLAGSFTLALVAMVLVFQIWYPAPLDAAAGVTTLFLVIIGVDVTLGPTLTLIVFNPGKKSLRFDLTTIVVLQLVAFAYGLWTVAEGRPAWLVFNADRFDLVRAAEVPENYRAVADHAYRNAPWLGPRWVAARRPTDPEQRRTLMFEALFAGVDLPQRPDLYYPLPDASALLKERAHPLDELLRYNPAPAVEAIRSRWPNADAWLPMMSPARAVTVLLEKQSARVVAVVDLQPWN